MSADKMPSPDFVVIDQRAQERRGGERRSREIPVARERRQGTDRRKRPRRRMVDPTTCERQYTEEEITFMNAMDQYKRANGRPFPTWGEVLEVLYALGYRRVEKAGDLPGRRPEAHSVAPRPKTG